MKSLLYTSALFISISLCAQTPCESGMADIFPCENYDLVSQIPLSTMNSVKANDSWGWTDPMDGKEYAIICLNEATAFIDISDPLNPIYLGQMPGESTQHTTWRDAKTYENHVYVVSEDSGHGMQVFDLTRLRNVASPPEIFTPDNVYTDFGSAHNIAINEDTGYAYALGTSTFSGGAHFIDLSDPANPVADGGHNADGYTHDAHIVTYNGPDSDYTGQEIMIASNETEVDIVDVTDKANPVTIGTIAYNNVNYTHQGWLTEDHRYFILGDETDELNTGINSRTIFFDFEDLDNPQFHFEYEGPTGATDHNGYVKGDKFYLANNAAGLRVVDISDIANANATQEGYFDSYPTNDNSGFNGSWNVYPFFESGHIVISDRAQGFLLVRPSDVLGTEDAELEASIAIYPNPVINEVAVASPQFAIESIKVTDLSGKQVYVSGEIAQGTHTLDLSRLSAGIYFITLNDQVTKKIIKQ
ncbi:choice-of-anchor B family protein [Aureisphaera galaxeae]|uniref:choice-of-anchor B family protein n=1 Tax=Aureisphaera galaxeae TaxID=1538023 RepID=UPI0023506BC4|nr:choice-of-anchor B family protein [Aureisphaera galaxeae]MDC8004117.1 choice-of-anchor B family protein [Aureisphaera galaxeae]